jgi:hypothetical protein
VAENNAELNRITDAIIGAAIAVHRNFNERLLKHGIKRVVRELEE